MTQFPLNDHEYIELNKLLKILRWVNSGGDANMLIVDGLVRVNGEVEIQKRKKTESCFTGAIGRRYRTRQSKTGAGRAQRPTAECRKLNHYNGFFDSLHIIEPFEQSCVKLARTKLFIIH